MKTATATLAILSSLSALSTLVEGFVYPSNPVSATVWKPNATVTITWSDDKLAPLLSSKPVFDIFLMTGSDDHQTKLATIASDVNGGTTNSVKYKVPYVSPPGQIYFLMFQTRDLKSTAWATRFTITDANGNPGTLRPTIPAGGKINPGGVGAITAAPPKSVEQQPPKPAEQPPQQHPEEGKENEKEQDKDKDKEEHKEQEQEQSTTTTTAAGSEATQASPPAPASGKTPVGSGKNSTIGTHPAKAVESIPVSVDMGAKPNKGVNDGHGSGNSSHSGATLAGVTASSMVIAAFIGFMLLLI